MTMNDLLGDTLTRIRNGYNANLLKIETKNSKLVVGVLKILYEEGYIDGYYVNHHKNTITITLKYTNDQPSIRKIVRISKPGNRIYISSKEIPRVSRNYTLKSGNLKKSIAENYSMFIITTPKGVMTHKEALVHKVGGEILCQVL